MLNKISIVFAIAFLLSFGFVVADVNSDIYASWSFENFPSNQVIDDSGNNHTLNLSDSFNQISSNSKLGDWSSRFQFNTQTASPFVVGDVGNAWTSSSARSYSFWVYPISQESTTSYALFRDGGASGSVNYILEVWINQYDGISAMNTWSGSIGCSTNSGAASFYCVRSEGGINYNEWNHIVMTYGGDSSDKRVYLNSVAQETHTGSLIWGSNLNGGTGKTFNLGMGRCGNVANCEPFRVYEGDGVSRIDQFIYYEKTLTQEDVNVLYNAGLGFDPFDDSTPQQIANIAPYVMGYSTSEDRQLNEFFTGETYYTVAFDYNLANYFINSSGSANTGDFAVQLGTGGLLRVFSYTTDVGTFPMTIQACNSNGCTDTSVTLTIGDGMGTGSGSGIIGIASVAGIELTTGQTKTRQFGNFFMNYENRFIEFVDPDTNLLVYVSEGFPNDNSCFTASVNGDLATWTAKNTTCSVSTRLVVDDGTTSVASNTFTVSVVAQETGIVFVDSFLGLFPDKNTIPFSARMFYVILTMLLTGVIGVFLIYNSKEVSPTLITMMTALLIMFEVVFFTAIGYIPLWIVAVGAIGIVVLGIGWFTNTSVGAQ